MAYRSFQKHRQSFLFFGQKRISTDCIQNDNIVRNPREILKSLQHIWVFLNFPLTFILFIDLHSFGFELLYIFSLRNRNFWRSKTVTLRTGHSVTNFLKKMTLFTKLHTTFFFHIQNHILIDCLYVCNYFLLNSFLPIKMPQIFIRPLRTELTLTLNVFTFLKVINTQTTCLKQLDILSRINVRINLIPQRTRIPINRGNLSGEYLSFFISLIVMLIQFLV